MQIEPNSAGIHVPSPSPTAVIILWCVGDLWGISHLDEGGDRLTLWIQMFFFPLPPSLSCLSSAHSSSLPHWLSPSGISANELLTFCIPTTQSKPSLLAWFVPWTLSHPPWIGMPSLASPGWHTASRMRVGPPLHTTSTGRTEQNWQSCAMPQGEKVRQAMGPAYWGHLDGRCLSRKSLKPMYRRKMPQTESWILRVRASGMKRLAAAPSGLNLRWCMWIVLEPSSPAVPTLERHVI